MAKSANEGGPGESPLRQSLDLDGILTVAIDSPGRGTNILDDALIQALGQAIDRIAADDAVKGAIITSGKPDFLAGADLDALLRLRKAEEVYPRVRDLQSKFRRLETAGKPVAAALAGSTLGPGLELALSCHYRVALANEQAKFGLPEVKLGLLAGAGGTQRLPRLIGIQAALPLLLEGMPVNAAKAFELGIIDAVADTAEDLMQRARQWVLANPAACNPWDRKGYKYPGGGAGHPSVAQLLAAAPAQINKKTHRNFPAPINILSSVVEGSLVDFDTALKIEARCFTELAVGQVANNLIGTMWVQLNALNRGESRPKDFPRSTVRKLGVVGAGMMGAAIAHVSAEAGIDVVLKDVTKNTAEAGKAHSADILAKALEQGRVSEAQVARVLGRIQTTDRPSDLEGCDFVIEAVFEDRELKAKVTGETEAVMDASGVFGSNTSTIPITRLAQASMRPDRFIGVHFFSPAEKMPLVEIIVGKRTSPQTLARAFDYVQQIGKTPIVVNDARGFYTSRVFATYVLEAAALLLEGQDPAAIENAGLAAGMPVAPLALQDEVALSLSLQVARQAKKDAEAEGHRYFAHPGEVVIERMVEELDRPGRKAGKGYYEYPRGGRKFLWPELSRHFPRAGKQLDQRELVDRLMFVQANEAARCFEEGVVTAVADANIGSILGWGFAPHQGGVLQFINAYGLKNFVARARELARYGERFRPAAILESMAAEARTF